MGRFPEPSDHDTAAETPLSPGNQAAGAGGARNATTWEGHGKIWLGRAAERAEVSLDAPVCGHSTNMDGASAIDVHHKVIPGSRIVADPDQVARRYDPA